MANPMILYLRDEDRDELQELVSKGNHSVRKIKRAQVLLASETGQSAHVIGELIGVSAGTVHNVRARYVQEGLTRALNELPRPGKPKKIYAREEALITGIACSKPPTGHDHWTLQMIADRVVQLTDLTSLSKPTVMKTLKKANSNPGSLSNGASVL